MTSSYETELEADTKFTLADLISLRNKSFRYGNNREVSSVIEEERDAEQHIRVNKTEELGELGSVRHKINWPAFESVSGIRRRVISFHSHPDIAASPELVGKHNFSSESYPKSGAPAEMLPSIAPSYYQYRVIGGGGDLALTLASNEDIEDPKSYDRDLYSSWRGGSLNIITKDGVTLFVGVQPLERDMKVVSQSQAKIGTNLDDRYQPTWRVLHGSNKDQINGDLGSFTDKMDASAQGLDLLADNGVGVLRLDYFSAQRALYFVTLSWEVLESVVEEAGGLHEVTFGNGLTKVAEILKRKYGVRDLPVESSLTEVLIKPVFPVRREKKSVWMQHQILELVSKQKWDDEDWNKVIELFDSLSEVTEIKNGIELRALFFKMSGQLPWPEMLRNRLENLIENENTGLELIDSLEDRKKLENNLVKDMDYERLLPIFYFDVLAQRAIQLYKLNPDTSVGLNKYGRLEFKNVYLHLLITVINIQKNRLEAYINQWAQLGAEEQAFAQWLLKYEMSSNEPL